MYITFEYNVKYNKYILIHGLFDIYFIVLIQPDPDQNVNNL